MQRACGGVAGRAGQGRCGQSSAVGWEGPRQRQPLWGASSSSGKGVDTTGGGMSSSAALPPLSSCPCLSVVLVMVSRE